MNFLNQGQRTIAVKEKTIKFNCIKQKSLSPLKKKIRRIRNEQASQELQHEKGLVSRLKSTFYKSII